MTLKVNAPGTPPPHRLPVLTEVVRLTDGEAAAPGDDATPAWARAEPPAPEPAPAPLFTEARPQGGLAAPMHPVSDADHVLVVPLPVPPPPGPLQAVPAVAPAVVPAPAMASVAAPSVPVAPSASTVVAMPTPSVAPPPAPGALPDPLATTADTRSPPEWLKRRPSQAPVALPLPAMAPPSPLPPDFSGSWWSRDEGPVVVASPVPVPIPAPLPATAPPALPSEDELVQRVLEGLGGQIDLLFDHRMRDAVVPALARVADQLVDGLKTELARTLHEMVSRAVTVELARERQRRGGS